MRLLDQLNLRLGVLDLRFVLGLDSLPLCFLAAFALITPALVLRFKCVIWRRSGILCIANFISHLRQNANKVDGLGVWVRIVTMVAGGHLY